MGVRLAVSLAAFLLAIVPISAVADDIGSPQDVRGIRGELPLLMAARVRAWGIDPQSIVVESVAVTGNYALARWHAGTRDGVEGFVRIFDRWWDRMTTTPCIAATSPLNGANGTRIAVDAMLLKNAGFPEPLVSMAAQSLGLPLATAPVCPNTPAPFTPRSDTDGYGVQMTLPQSAANVARGAIQGRKPTEAESWITPHGDGFFFFYILYSGTALANVPDGTTLDVWYPFLLDPSLRYSLTIAFADRPIGPIDGTLHDNVVHFDLPAFVAAPGVKLMCEIDGDPR
jgi:hypothetical protein